jgi:hypothetical protein
LTTEATEFTETKQIDFLLRVLCELCGKN